MTMTTGPYLTAALFCERVLQEKDGVLTIVRVIDRIIQSASGVGAPEQMPLLNYNLTAVIILKSGRATGTVQVKVDMEAPSGLVKQGLSMSALMEGGERGQNLIMMMQLQFQEPGLYWFNVHVDNQMVTRMPLRVIYTRIGSPPPQ